MTRPDLALAEIVALVRATRLRAEAESALVELDEREQVAASVSAERARIKRAKNPHNFRPRYRVDDARFA